MQNENKRRRRRVKNKGRASLAVMAVLVVAMVGLALLLTRQTPGGSAGSAAPLSEPLPLSDAAWAASLPAAQSSPPLGPYSEEEIPPLYNAANPIPDVESYQANLELVDVGNSQQMEARAGRAFLAMQQAAAEDGISIFAFSGYRSHQRQQSNYNNSIQRYLAQGYSRAEAERLTQQYYAIPGTSEHEAGLAVDINGIEESFENTEAFRWLGENAAEYGFILRYPKDAESIAITGINYEPWHYRYIGSNFAMDMVALGELDGILTLEKYLETLGQNTRDTGVGVLPG